MKNKNLFVSLQCLVFLFCASVSRAEESGGVIGGTSVAAEESASSASSSPSKFKATAQSYYYDFQGAKAANDDLYSFGGTTLFMQMLSLQYQVNRDWTVLFLGTHMSNYVETNMFGMTFRDKTMGWGDVLIDAIRPLYMSSNFMLFGDIGVSVPTGSINKKNASNPNLNYAYNMQLGSGTVDGQGGLTAIYFNEQLQAGTHLSTFQRTGRNPNGYRLGNLYKAEGWLDFPMGAGFTPRVVGYYKVKSAIHGQDKTLGRTVLTEYYHHDQRNWDVSAALKFERAVARRLTLTAEAGHPIYQDAQNSDNVVVQTNYYGTVGVSGTF